MIEGFETSFEIKPVVCSCNQHCLVKSFEYGAVDFICLTKLMIRLCEMPILRLYDTFSLEIITAFLYDRLVSCLIEGKSTRFFRFWIHCWFTNNNIINNNWWTVNETATKRCMKILNLIFAQKNLVIAQCSKPSCCALKRRHSGRSGQN